VQRHCRHHPQVDAEVVGEGVQEFNYGLVVVAIGWGEHKAHEHTSETDNGMQLEPEVLHGLAATHSIVRCPDKVTALFCPFVSHTGHGD